MGLYRSGDNKKMSVELKYSRAICRGISSSLAKEAQRLSDDHEPINEKLMSEQHEKYTATLESCGIAVTNLPSDSNLPDCVFTEDAAVVCGQKAVLTRLGHPNRRGEHEEMRKALESLGMQVFDMTKSPETNAFCDGGDVLFTGFEFFVGDSKRTTSEGADFIQSSFGHPTHLIPVGEELHLKSNCSLLAPGKIIFSDDAAGRDLAKDIKLAAKESYEYIFVPDVKASNVVYIKNGSNKQFLLAPSGYPQSMEIIRNAIRGDDIQIIELSNAELSKVDGCLTCCSVLIQ